MPALHFKLVQWIDPLGFDLMIFVFQSRTEDKRDRSPFTRGLACLACHKACSDEGKRRVEKRYKPCSCAR